MARFVWRPRLSTTRRASLTLVLEIGCRTLSAGQPATSRDSRRCVHWLTKEGRGRGGSPFCPLGASFQAGAVATLYRRRIRSVPSVRGKKAVRRRIHGRSYHIYRICPLVAAVYKYPVARLPFSLLTSALILAFASLPSHARAHPRAVADPPSFHPRMPMRLVVDIWERNKELIRKRTDIGEHFTQEIIQSIVFIFLPLGERVHLTNWSITTNL